MVQSLFDHVHARSTVVETPRRDAHHGDLGPGHCERPPLHRGTVLEYQNCVHVPSTLTRTKDFWPFQSLFVERMVDYCVRIRSNEKTTNDDEIEPPGRRFGPGKLYLTSINLSLSFCLSKRIVLRTSFCFDRKSFCFAVFDNDHGRQRRRRKIFLLPPTNFTLPPAHGVYRLSSTS